MQIKGLDKLNQQLKELEKLGENKQALLAGGYILQKLSQENAPVDTGYLRNSAYTEETQSGVEVGFTAEYAAYQEFGTETIPAKGFMRKAVDEGATEIIEKVKEVLKGEL
jgi:HK97 gp10 family phage protein